MFPGAEKFFAVNNFCYAWRFHMLRIRPKIKYFVIISNKWISPFFSNFLIAQYVIAAGFLWVKQIWSVTYFQTILAGKFFDEIQWFMKNYCTFFPWLSHAINPKRFVYLMITKKVQISE